jgi:hypothetical protein
MGSEFEQRIENAVEKAVVSSMGSLLIALGQEMLFSDSADNTFETRMESFGENIANEMEARADKIELKAEQLCVSVHKIDQLEEQLKASITELAPFDVLTTSINLTHSDEQKKLSNNAM